MGCDMRVLILPSVELDKYMVSHGLHFPIAEYQQQLQSWLIGATSTDKNALGL